MTHRRRPSGLRILTVGAAAVALGLATIAGPASAAAESAAAAKATPMDRSHQMSAADRAAIDAAAATYLANAVDQTPGLWIAVWDPAKGFYEQAYGKASLDGTPAQVGDHFRIGSLTKTIFATAVLEKVADDTIALDDTVKQLAPMVAKRFPATAKSTVRQLLGMTTSLPDYADAAVMRQFANPQQHWSRDQLIALGLSEGTPITGPGGYSTTNYLVLGKVMEAVTGKSPEKLVNAVLKRAGLQQTRLPRGNVAVPAPAAHGYLGAIYGPQAATVNPALSATTDTTDWTMEWGKEGGGATSTIGNLARWGSLCLGDALLPKKIVAQRLHVTPINAGKYGLGIIREGDWLAHGGQTIGYEANVACNPRTGAVVAYAVNSTEGLADLSAYLGPVAWPYYLQAVAGG